jgi:hypothetical protein
MSSSELEHAFRARPNGEGGGLLVLVFDVDEILGNIIKQLKSESLRFQFEQQGKVLALSGCLL